MHICINIYKQNSDHTLFRDFGGFFFVCFFVFQLEGKPGAFQTAHSLNLELTYLASLVASEL